MKRRHGRLVFALSGLCCCVVAASALAEAKLAMPFSSNMVLQREMALPVWGTATPGESVTIKFAGQSKSATADSSGKWIARLDPLAASAESRSFTVEAANRIVLESVLVGEVWLCAGQSNMQIGLERLKVSKFPSEELKAAVLERIERELATTTPGIRLFRGGTDKDDVNRNVWMECGPEALKGQAKGLQGFSAVGYFFGQQLKSALNVPIGLMDTAVGNTIIEMWTPPEGKHFRSLVEPLAPFPMRGMIWYQGESNLMAGNNGVQYAAKLEALILGWRQLWRQPDMPFYYVQLPPMNYANKRGPITLTAEALPHFREGQALALRLPNTGMVVSTDLADVTDLHPANKWDVGKRLALVAMARTYGQRDVAFSGPVYRAMERRVDHVIIRFDHAEGGLVSKGGKPLSEFQIAGADGHFSGAEAVIEGENVLVSSESVPQPMAVRFAWKEESRPNLFNKADLPAAPFRTDEWPVAVASPDTAGVKPGPPHSEQVGATP